MAKTAYRGIEARHHGDEGNRPAPGRFRLQLHDTSSYGTGDAPTGFNVTPTLVVDKLAVN
jgi:hypothetical protein